MQQWHVTGSSRAHGTGGRKRHPLERHAALVYRLLASKRDITLQEPRAGLADEGVAIGRSSIDRYLKARGLTRKKNIARRRAGAR